MDGISCRNFNGISEQFLDANTTNDENANSVTRSTQTDMPLPPKSLLLPKKNSVKTTADLRTRLEDAEMRRWEYKITHMDLGHVHFRVRSQIYHEQLHFIMQDRAEKIIQRLDRKMKQTSENKAALLKERCNRLRAKRSADFVRQVRHYADITNLLELKQLESSFWTSMKARYPNIQPKKNLMRSDFWAADATGLFKALDPHWIISSSDLPNTVISAQLPARLLRISNKPRAGLTLSDIQEKMLAVDRRRIEFESRLKERLQNSRKTPRTTPIPDILNDEEALNFARCKVKRSANKRDRFLKERRDRLLSKRFAAFTRKVHLHVARSENAKKIHLASQAKLKHYITNRHEHLDQVRNRLHEQDAHAAVVRERKKSGAIDDDFEIVSFF